MVPAVNALRSLWASIDWVGLALWAILGALIVVALTAEYDSTQPDGHVSANLELDGGAGPIRPAAVLVDHLEHYRHTAPITHVDRVIDGDTIVADLELWPHLAELDVHIRLADVDTPERGQPGYDKAAAVTSSWLALHAELELWTNGLDHFGRTLAVVADAATGDTLNAHLAAQGWRT